jgi:hypothetical protein
MRTQRTSPRTTYLLIGWLAFVLIACNLGTAPGTAPPTLVPRASATPAPTLGYNPGSGQVNPDGSFAPGNASTPVASIDQELQNLMNQVTTDRLMAHVRELQNFYTRHVNSSKSSDGRGIGAARAYIRQQFEFISESSQGRFQVQEQEFQITYNDVTSNQYNVYGILGGTQSGASTIVVGAHYDSVGDPQLIDPAAYAPGANDNGTGVAGLIELARIMSQRQYRSTIIFVAFSAEEVGRRGSRAFARQLQELDVDLVGMINLDSIGNANDRRGNVNMNDLRVFSDDSAGSSSRHMARTMEFLSFAHNASMEMIVEDAADRENRFGDHFSFSEVGYPAIRFINTLEEKGNADPTDTLDAVEPEYLKRATESILLMITTLADGPLPPPNITLRQSENGNSTLRWEPVPDAVRYVVALRPPGSLRYEQQFEVNDPFVNWSGFGSYAGVAVASVSTSGLVGRLSDEYTINRQ